MPITVQQIVNNALKFLENRLNKVIEAIDGKKMPKIDLKEVERRIEEVQKAVESQTKDILAKLGTSGDSEKFASSMSEVREVLERFKDMIAVSFRGIDPEKDKEAREELMTALGEEQKKVVDKIGEQTVALSKMLESKPEDNTKQQMIDRLDMLITSVKAIKPTTTKVDMSGMKSIGTDIRNLTKEVRKKDNSKVEALLMALGETFNNFKVEIPRTIKLDEDQLRELGAARFGGGGGSAVAAIGGGQATSVTVANVAMATSGTEYSYTFPANTVGFILKLRAQNLKFQYTWTSGDSGTTYLTAPQNFLRSKDGIDFSGKTIYFQAASNSQTMENERYQL